MSHSCEGEGQGGGGRLTLMSSSAEARTHLDGDVALGNLPHVEPNGGDHVFIELTTLQERWKGGAGEGTMLRRCTRAYTPTSFQ